MTAPTHTDFGFEQVPWADKTDRVREVFDRVASNYDCMNDALSLGIHRLWKRFAIRVGQVNTGDTVLDLAAGSGDLTLRWADAVGASGQVVMTDININMLNVGLDRLLDQGYWKRVLPAQVDAEALPFPSNCFDCISLGFGLRNMTDHSAVFREAYRVLKPGGRFVVLEFSHPKHPLIAKLYDAYSFEMVPRIGAWISNDAESYRYLVESIRKHPKAAVLRERMMQAGFDRCDITYLSAGVVAVHCGVKF